METRNIAIGVLAGLAVGAALGVLFAPDSGSNTRKMIAHKSNNLKYDLESKFNELMAGMSQQFEAIKDEATAMADHAKHEAKSL